MTVMIPRPSPTRWVLYDVDFVLSNDVANGLCRLNGQTVHVIEGMLVLNGGLEDVGGSRSWLEQGCGGRLVRSSNTETCVINLLISRLD